MSFSLITRRRSVLASVVVRADELAAQEAAVDRDRDALAVALGVVTERAVAAVRAA